MAASSIRPGMSNSSIQRRERSASPSTFLIDSPMVGRGGSDGGSFLVTSAGGASLVLTGRCGVVGMTLVGVALVGVVVGVVGVVVGVVGVVVGVVGVVVGVVGVVVGVVGVVVGVVGGGDVGTAFNHRRFKYTRVRPASNYMYSNSKHVPLPRTFVQPTKVMQKQFHSGCVQLVGSGSRSIAWIIRILQGPIEQMWSFVPKKVDWQKGSVGFGQPCAPRWVGRIRIRIRPIERVRLQWIRLM